MELNLITFPPQNLTSLFHDKVYHIPEYQRSYEWTLEKCETLWNDLMNHFRNPDDGYFLGIIVLIRGKDNVSDVVDGQQRLISLSLLLRVLYEIDGRNGELRRCLYQTDSRDENKILGNYVYSDVLGNIEQKQLEQCLSPDVKLDSFKLESDSLYERNLAFFRTLLLEVTPENDRLKFIDHLLNNVYILPVSTDNHNKALTIFETINNRGQDLTDGDIFKTILYGLAKKNNTESEFIEHWNQLQANSPTDTKEDSLTFFFRCYMHVLRGLYEDKGNLSQLRSFFTDGRVYSSSKEVINEQKYRLDSLPWHETMANLEKIKKAWTFLQSGEFTAIQNWKYILQSYQNDIWIYPVLTFIYTNMNDSDSLDEKDIESCCQFMCNIARYLYAKGFDYASIQGKSTQEEMFMATECAAKKKKYSPEIKLTSAYIEKLNGNITVPRFRRGFCAILEYLKVLDIMQSGDISKQYNVFKRADVEHILPQKWENGYYDKWDDGTVKRISNTLGNLCLLETLRNIKGSNKFFTEKKLKSYVKSSYVLVKELVDFDQWTFEEYKQRQDTCVEKIVRFLENEN
jgi:uncharacterized protein with ParB-like and HNH nuclease domain